MKWVRKGEYYKESVDGKYAVCRYGEKDFAYLAWYRAGKIGTRQIGPRFESSEEAIELCEQHAIQSSILAKAVGSPPGPPKTRPESHTTDNG